MLCTILNEEIFQITIRLMKIKVKYSPQRTAISNQNRGSFLFSFHGTLDKYYVFPNRIINKKCMDNRYTKSIKIVYGGTKMKTQRNSTCTQYQMAYKLHRNLQSTVVRLNFLKSKKKGKLTLPFRQNRDCQTGFFV